MYYTKFLEKMHSKDANVLEILFVTSRSVT